MSEQSKTSTDQELPQKPLERNVPPRGEVPSTGFSTPHQRDRFELIKRLTDEHTAIQLYSMVYEGGYANFETALKSAIHQMSPKHDTVPDGTRWRYYCRECGFIGAASKTFSQAEHSSGVHDDAVSGCESVVFSYVTEDWDPDDVERLVEQYLQTETMGDPDV